MVDTLIREQLARWPAAQAKDLVKALYQAIFGSGHFVQPGEAGKARLRAEVASSLVAIRQVEPPFIEPLGGDYVRVHLSRLREAGLNPDTLFALFTRASTETAGSREAFVSALDHYEALIISGQLGLEQNSSLQFLADYRAAGCPAQSHSQAFASAYAPAYRLIRAQDARLLPLFCGIDQCMSTNNRVLVAIDGGSASGKTSTAALLAQVYDCNIFHMDDFFLQAHQRTPARFAQPGGNVDYERFEAEVLDPLKTGQAFSYRPFNCQIMDFDAPVSVVSKALNIIEGAYSLHPALSDAYDLRVLLEIYADEQAMRILRRNGPVMQQRFLREWIPLEQRYADATGLRERVDLII